MGQASTTPNCQFSRSEAMFSRRDLLAASAMGAAMTVSAANAGSFGNPDEPPQGAINAKNPASVTDPGPQDPAIRDQLQSAFSPPPTDVGGMPQIWSSFDAGDASEFNTLLVTDWFAHTPPAVLAENFGVSTNTFAKTPLNDLWIFQGKVPGDLPAVRKAMTGNAETPPQPFTFSLAASPNLNGTKNGTLHLADSSTFKVSTTIAAVVQTVPPGAMRSLHWHPNADEWQYYIKGKARMGVFNTGPHVLTMDFNPGDIGYVPRNYGHYVQNIGDTDMQFFAVFRTSNFQEFSLSDWLKHSPAEMVAEHLNVDPAMVPHWPGTNARIMPD